MLSHRGDRLGDCDVTWKVSPAGAPAGAADPAGPAAPEEAGGTIHVGPIAADILAKVGEIPLSAPVRDASKPTGNPSGPGSGTAAFDLSMMIARTDLPRSPDEVVAANSWRLWFVPRPDVATWDFTLIDPVEDLYGLEPAGAVRRADPEEDFPTGPGDVIVSTAWTPRVSRWVTAGAGVLLVLNHAPFLEKVPFWREAIPFFQPHPLSQIVPHDGYAGIQFKGVTPDCAIDERLLLEALGVEGAEARPVLTRFDARKFTVAHYLLEVAAPSGHLLITTLRLAGGFGRIPIGVPANRLGTHLLDGFVRYLR